MNGPDPRALVPDRRAPRPAGADDAHSMDAHRWWVAEALTRALRAGELDLPLPGAGGTPERWRALGALAERDLSLARLAEGHALVSAPLTRGYRVERPSV